MFRAVPCSSSGGQILLLQPHVSSLFVNSPSMPVESGLAVRSQLAYCTAESDDTRGCSNTICPPEDEQGTARNMLRIIMYHTYCYRIKEVCIKLVTWKKRN